MIGGKIKVLLLRDCNTGKTLIINKLNEDSNTEYKNSAAFFTKKINIDRKDITFELWDSSGQEKYHSILTSLYPGTGICVLVYDVMNQESLDNIDKWSKDIILQLGLPPEKYFPYLLYLT